MLQIRRQNGGFSIISPFGRRSGCTAKYGAIGSGATFCLNLWTSTDKPAARRLILLSVMSSACRTSPAPPQAYCLVRGTQLRLSRMSSSPIRPIPRLFESRDDRAHWAKTGNFESEATGGGHECAAVGARFLRHLDICAGYDGDADRGPSLALSRTAQQNVFALWVFAYSAIGRH